MKDVKLRVDNETFVRFWLVPLVFAAVIGAIFIARGPLIIVAISFFLVLVLNRPVSWLARHLPGKSRSFATLIAYLIIVAVVALVFFNVMPIFVKQLASFLSTLPETLHNLQQNSAWMTDFLEKYNLTAQYDEWLKQMQKEVTSLASSIGGSFVGALNGLVNALITTMFVAVLTFLMLVEAPNWEEKFWRLIYSDSKKRRYHQSVARKMYNVVGDYVSGQMTVAAISATMTALAVVVLGMIFNFELSLAWPAWTVIFVMTFIPMFGAMIGGIIVGLLLLLYSWPAALFYWAFFIIEQQVENNFTSPRIQAKRLHMSALVVLVAILFGLQVGGLLGALVAIPLAGCVMVLVREFLKNRRQRRAESAGEACDLDNEADIVVVFSEHKTFVRPQLPKIKKRSQKK